MYCSVETTMNSTVNLFDQSDKFLAMIVSSPWTLHFAAEFYKKNKWNDSCVGKYTDVFLTWNLSNRYLVRVYANG